MTGDPTPTWQEANAGAVKAEPAASAPNGPHHHLPDDLPPGAIQVLQVLPVPVFVLDVRQAGSPIGLVNPALTAATGYGEHELLGYPLSVLHGPATAAAAIATLDEAIALRRAAHAEIVFHRKGGAPLTGRVSLAPVTASDGTVLGLLGSQTGGSAEGPELATWAVDFTHDFNNLLQVMVGYAGLIIAASEKPEVDRKRIRRAAEALQVASERLSALVQGLAPLTGRPPP